MNLSQLSPAALAKQLSLTVLSALIVPIAWFVQLVMQVFFVKLVLLAMMEQVVSSVLMDIIIHKLCV